MNDTALSNSLIFRQLELGPMMNFVYIIGCEETRQAAVVDPAWDVPSLIETARQLEVTLSHILLTHAHPDHTNGLQDLFDATNADIYLHTEELVYIKKVATFYRMPLDFVDRRPEKIRAIADNEVFFIGKMAVRALHTPGHTPGSLCFLVGNKLLSGDTLFVGACGRVDTPGGDPEKMWFSLNRKLRSLEDDIVVYPGHSYGDRSRSTIGEEKRTNPYMQFDSKDQFLRAMGVS